MWLPSTSASVISTIVVVAQLRRCRSCRLLGRADAAAERRDERADLGRREHLVEARALDVEDLALEREDRLELAVAALLGASRRRCLPRRCRARPAPGSARLAVGELAGERGVVERALAHDLARLARGLARLGGHDGLLHDLARGLRVLLEEAAELVDHHVLDDALHLARDELDLGLRVERRVRVLDADDAGETFADVLAGEAALHVLEEVLRLAVAVEDARERGAEAREVRAAVLVVDVVRVAEDLLGVGRVPLQRDLDADAALRRPRCRRASASAEGDDLVVDGLLRLVEELDELADAALVLERLAAALAALVGQRDDEARR